MLNALQHNDTPYKDAGIEQSLAFSSPDFRPPPGSSEQFFEIVKNSIYSPLLNFRHVERQPLRLTDTRAEQRLTVTASDGSAATFVWVLARQSRPPYTGCWMTEGVLREE